MGATIALHAVVRGDAVRVLCLTDGSSTQYPGDEAKRAQKADEAVQAAKELGVDDYVHLDLPDMRLDTIPHADLNAVVEAQMQDFAPSTVYSVHPDVNRDHQAAFASVAVATRPFPGQTARRVLTYAPTSSTEWTPALISLFQPNWFVDVAETIDQRSRHSPATKRSSARTRIRGTSWRSERRPGTTARRRDANGPSRSCLSARSNPERACPAQR